MMGITNYLHLIRCMEIVSLLSQTFSSVWVRVLSAIATNVKKDESGSQD